MWTCFIHKTEGFCGQCFEESLAEQAAKLNVVPPEKPNVHIIIGPNGICVCGYYDGKGVTCAELLSKLGINWQQRAEVLAHDLEIAKSALKSAERDFQSQLHTQKQRAERLKKYLAHPITCPRYKGYSDDPCTCGLDDARKEAV